MLLNFHQESWPVIYCWIWLRTWPAKKTFKNSFTSSLLVGNKLFGDCFRLVLMEFKDERKLYHSTYSYNSLSFGRGSTEVRFADKAIRLGSAPGHKEFDLDPLEDFLLHKQKCGGKTPFILPPCAKLNIASPELFFSLCSYIVQPIAGQYKI